MVLGGSSTGKLSRRLSSQPTKIQLHASLPWTPLQRNVSEKICSREGLELGADNHYSNHVNWLERWGKMYSHPEMCVENIC